MVCRENKGRSAVIGLHKALLRRQGYSDFDDFEFQSGIHAYGHSYAAAGAPPREQQVAFLLGLRQQVEDDRHISDADKYRESANQPGIVTRIDQELARLRSGKDEHGRPLTPAKMMRGRDWAAMQHMGAFLRRSQDAKDQYFTVYARHTGVSLDEARNRFNTLARRSAGERKNTHISLRDSWRDDLAVAGVSSETQADLGQSNQTREALRIMENERRSALAARPKRPTIRAEHRIKTVRPGERQRQCVGEGGCGQFGHERSACPNQSQVRAIARAQNAENAAFERMDSYFDERLGRGMTPDEITSTPLYQALSDRAAQAASKRLRAEEDLGRQAPLVSDTFEEVAYNPSVGLVQVKTHDRFRRDGTRSPGKTYTYRMSPEEYDEMIAAGSVGAEQAEGFFWKRGPGGDRFRFENESDATAASEQTRCPTCGQWASMNSQHACAVPGSRQARQDAQRALDVKMAREAARANGQSPSELRFPPTTRFVPTGAKVRLDSGTQVFYAPRQDVLAVTQEGRVARAKVTYLARGASVEGTVPVWRDPASGELLVSRDERQLKCTCAEYAKNHRCGHTNMAVVVATAEYRGVSVNEHVQPGSSAEVARPSDDTSVGEEAHDAPPRTMTRRDYQRIVEKRLFNADVTAGRQGHGNAWMQAASTTDASGSPVPTPSRWSAEEGREVDLANAKAVQAELRRSLRKRANSEVPGGKHWSVRLAPSGGLFVTTAQNRMTAGGGISDSERAELSNLLGMPVQRISPRGAYIPGDAGWRAEFLDRAAGRPPRVRGGRLVAPGYLLDRDNAK